MKTFVFIAILLLFCANAISQTPKFINYQAVARYNNTNIPYPHQNVTINFKILQGTSTGTVVFDETQNTVTDDCGLINVKIGSVNTTDFSKINWASGNKYLQVTINNTVTGKTELVSVPYSLYAAKTLYADSALYAGKAAFADLAKSSLDWKNVGDTVLYSTGKKIGIGTTNPDADLDIIGHLRIKGDSTTLTSTRLRLDASSSLEDNWITSFDELGNRLWVLNLADRSIDNRLGLFSEKSQSYVFNVTTDGNVGIKTNASPSYALSVNGEVNINGNGSVKCLTVKGGCDWYEEANSEDNLQPGEVAIIDIKGAENSVKRSTKAYDPLVTGVVSGAGGINPGIGLKQDGILEGNTKIAMGGKVKVRVVGNVKPGDLLTSSNISGYAMTVKNKKKAFGAVLGKALSTPDKNDLVLMQVMMQ